MSDLYHTIRHEGSSQYKEKMSRFLGFSFPVKTAEEARGKVKDIQNEYHDARHVCWAYMLGPERKEWQLNDNGEPSGTAGKPILGQINSLDVTDVVVIVVRYFGGIKLGTSGLAEAYREAAREAIEAGEVIECHDMTDICLTFPYMSADRVMKIVKGENIEVLDRVFDNSCSMTLRVRKDMSEMLKNRLVSIDGVTI
ncbi:MAG: YigZ family protein [Muribaculaceae bacterium]|nr:YigZ family protein [Bacteroidales bacterium]MDE6083327.1 YigZ family protein [Muribaculaceae bacterium]